MGILNTAPAEVFTVSALIGAEPLLGIMMAATLVHSAVLIMAPKFRISVISSKIKNSCGSGF